MSSHRLFLSPVEDIPQLDVVEWRDELARELRDGAHVVTLFGAPAGTRLQITAVLSCNARLTAIRTSVEPASGYHTLTPDFPALQAFERELHEQHGVRIAGHPWLKAIRFETTGREARDAYPFYEIEGKEVHEVAVGPIHAGVIEPGSFRFMCHGEQVHHLEIHLGYQHRGVEKLLLRRDPGSLAPLVETIAGDASVAHTWAYAAAVEALAEVAPSMHMEAGRGMMLELERVAMHLAGLAGMSADIGFLQGASTYGRLRTTAINTSMRACGSRFGRSAVRPAGSGLRLEMRPSLASVAHSVFTLDALERNLKVIADDIAVINDHFLSAETVRQRLQGVGTLSTELAQQIGVVGLVARASGIASDLRTQPSGIYEKHPIGSCIETDGDCLARARVRIREIAQSLEWIRSLTDTYAEWTPSRGRGIGPLAPRRLVVALTESWRGEVVHAIETDADGRLAHYKVQDPSFRNWLGLALAVRGNEISDFPICNKSFDLSYCGNDL